MSATGDRLAFTLIHSELCSMRDRLKLSVDNHSMSPTVYTNMKGVLDDLIALIALISKCMPKR